MIEVKPLQRDQYRQAAEWEYGPQPEGMDWERHAQEMEVDRVNLAIYKDGQFCGMIAYEVIEPDVYRVHVVKQPKTVTPHELSDLLVRIAGYQFMLGIEWLEALVPAGYRPSRRLAIRTGMTFRENVGEFERFAISKEEYYDKYVDHRNRLTVA